MDDTRLRGRSDEPPDVPAVAIELAIRRAWGLDPAEPRLRPSLPDVLALEPYEPLIAVLRSRFTGFDDRTDWNYEFCWTFWFSDGDDVLSLRLSALGPFAVLNRMLVSVSEDGRRSLRAEVPCEVPASETERQIAELTTRAGFRLLNSEELAKPVALDLKKIEPDIEDYENDYHDGWVSTYQALFDVLHGNV
jgi:hypothetical protein